MQQSYVQSLRMLSLLVYVPITVTFIMYCLTKENSISANYMTVNLTDPEQPPIVCIEAAILNGG